MAAHRYWRAIYPETWGSGSLAISEFHLLSNTSRVDASATLTSNIAPTSGSLANLIDDNTATDAVWSAALVRGLVLNWDFGGSPQSVDDIRVGSADSQATMLYSVRLQSSDDTTTWTEELQVFAISYPGARTKTTSQLRGLWNPYDTAAGHTVLPGKSTVVWTGGLTRASTSRSSGVLQFETQLTGGTGFGGAMGVVDSVAPLSNSVGSSGTGYSVGYVNSGSKALSGTTTAYGANWLAGDVIGTVCDFTAGTVTFYKNGVSQGVAASTLAGKTVYPASGSTNNSGAIVTIRPTGFTYPIAGATAWDTQEIIKTEVNGGRAIAAPTPFVHTAAGISTYKVQSVDVIRMRRDMNWNFIGQGIGRLKGTTKDKGTPNVPVSERVRLYRQKDGLLMREVWSTVGTGAYSFDYIDELDTYFVVSFDHDLNFRAVIADNLTLAGGGVELIP